MGSYIMLIFIVFGILVALGVFGSLPPRDPEQARKYKELRERLTRERKENTKRNREKLEQIREEAKRIKEKRARQKEEEKEAKQRE